MNSKELAERAALELAVNESLRNLINGKLDDMANLLINIQYFIISIDYQSKEECELACQFVDAIDSILEIDHQELKH